MSSPSRKQALKVAQRLGCYGAHQNEEGAWMPCADHETFTSVSRGEQPASKKWFVPELHRKAASVTGRGKLFSSREEALAESKRNGCSGVRVVMVNGGKMYAACMPKNNGAPENTGMISPRKRDFEPLGERGVVSIDTLPDGGLVSGKEYDIEEIDAKGFVNYVSRSTDPDVYTDRDSARVRARQLGCIGIRSYTARDGKRVYLPCTNGSDYNRVMGLRPDGRRKKKKSDCGCNEKSLAKTPAPKKDKIFGSRKNRVGSSGSLRSAGDISMTPEIVASLTKKVREHNSQVKKSGKENWSKTNLRALKAVYRRGAGAFSVSHRPGMNRNQWSMGRVNAFLRLLSSGSAKSSYTTDNDLLPKGHPWKKKGISGKSFTIDDSEYFVEELSIGVKSIGQKKFVAQRFIAFPLPKECEE
jgi:hypothetical protein